MSSEWSRGLKILVGVLAALVILFVGGAVLALLGDYWNGLSSMLIAVAIGWAVSPALG